MVGYPLRTEATPMKHLLLAAAIGLTALALAACDPTPKTPKAATTAAVTT